MDVKLEAKIMNFDAEKTNVKKFNLTVGIADNALTIESSDDTLINPGEEIYERTVTIEYDKEGCMRVLLYPYNVEEPVIMKLDKAGNVFLNTEKLKLPIN